MSTKQSLALVFLCLFVVQLLCFGPIMSHVGFYLDDWATLCFLHFAPKDGGYLGLLHYYLFNDSRVLIRPLEVLHYGTIYFFSGDKPLLYHVVNLFFELLCSIFYYLLLHRLTGRRALSLCGALLLMLYPSHDSTHYWVICSSVALSLALFLAAFCCGLRARDSFVAGEKLAGWRFEALAAFLFFLSLLNYEVFLPLAAVTVVVCAALTWRQGVGPRETLRQAALAASPLGAAAIVFIVFLKVIVPMLGKGYAHAIKLDPTVMLSTIGRGLVLNAPPEALQFFLAQSQAAVNALTSSEMIRLVVLTVVALASIIILAWGDRKVSAAPAVADRDIRLGAFDLIAVGLFTTFISYTIFGLSPDYMPTFITLVNRVNTGATVGVGFILIASLIFIDQKIADRRAYCATLALVSSLSIVLFTLADWGQSKPWIVSWTTQKQVRDSLLKLPSSLDKDSSILLMSCPRYVMWSPVFDGVWDYQNMVRITLNQPQFKANVVSERLSISPGAIKDVSYGYECGSYPFDKLFLMVAPHPELIPARTAEVFVDTVQQRGMTFGLDEKTLSKWRQQSAAAPKLEASH